MKKIDKFILKAFAGPFIAILLVVLFVLVMQFLWLYIDELVGKGLGMRIIMEFLGWGCATLLPLALPLATLLASMMTLGSLSENNELLAIKSAGVSLARIFLPLIVSSIVISIGAFFSANSLVPKAYYEIYGLRADILKTKEEIKIPPKTFYDGIEGFILRVEDQEETSGIMHDIMVYDHSSGKGNTTLALADSALIDISEDKSFLTFTMYNGVNYEETNTKKYRDTTLQIQKVRFTRQQMIIPLENYAFQKSEENVYGDQVKTKRLVELIDIRDSTVVLNGIVLEDHLSEMMRTMPLKYARQLDTSGAGGITSVIEHKDYLKWSRMEDEIQGCISSLTKSRDLVSQLSGFTRDNYEYVYRIRKSEEGIFSKFALALACFVFFFIGAPLGALIRKGGLGTPAIISVLFFVLYWVVDLIGKKLAMNGALPSAAGSFSSTIVLMPIGAYLTLTAIKDSSLNMDNVKTGFRKLWSQISGFFKKKRIVYMGTPEFAVEPLDRLIKTGHKIVGVVTVADKASGRGLKVNESAVKKYAVEHGIPVLQPVSLKDPEFIDAIKAWKPDLFVVVAFRMLPKVVWSIPKFGTFNLHAALLPQYRGAAPINWAIINGENMTGVTTFMIDDGIDTGQIMIREQCRIDEKDSAGTLHDKLMELGAETVVNTVDAIFQGNVDLRVQKTFIQGSEVLKPAPKLTKELCHVSWNATSRSVYNLIRGLSPYPGAFTMLEKDGNSQQFKIFATEIVPQDKLRTMLDAASVASPAPGTILSDGKTYLSITTSDGALNILDVQLQGKKRMDIRSFLVGFREPDSYNIG